MSACRLSLQGTLIKLLKLTLIVLPILATGISPTALAGSEERWFQVELIAFARRTADSGLEHWPTNVQLRYPARWHMLRDPNAADTDQPETSSPEPAGTSRRADLARDAFYLLPDTEKQLKRHADALSRDSRYRLLFHESWRQPGLEQSQAPALLISGGNAYGNHHELEGSILLYLSRFLHLQTELWFTDFEVNYGQRPDAWPSLPQHPTRMIETTAPGTGQPGALGLTNTDSWSLELNTNNYLSDLPTSLGEPYLPKRIVTLQQSRRMRSDELHYIDHPVIGLIVKITPYQRPATR